MTDLAAELRKIASKLSTLAAQLDAEGPTVKAPAATWTREACADWSERYGGTAPGGRIGKALKPLVTKHGWEGVRPSWQAFLRETEARFASAERFAQTFGSWQRPKDEIHPWLKERPWEAKAE